MANNVKSYREAADLTQDQLAQHLGISVSHLSRIENGKKELTIPMAARIAERLGCRIDDLLS